MGSARVGSLRGASGLGLREYLSESYARCGLAPIPESEWPALLAELDDTVAVGAPLYSLTLGGDAPAEAPATPRFTGGDAALTRALEAKLAQVQQRGPADEPEAAARAAADAGESDAERAAAPQQGVATAELDMADAERDLAALGYACGPAGAAYRPAHAMPSAAGDEVAGDFVTERRAAAKCDALSAHQSSNASPSPLAPALRSLDGAARLGC